ncbi:divalent metal cation transporter [Rhizobium sp. RAF56]|uniref:divalent metal cation transporter n=1 Tax=Rhizobium sp. RAF56 TaxID=3233062 RepID=UPI003F951750
MAVLKNAKAFYATIAVATLGSIGVAFAGLDPIRALYWSAVINGILSPPLIAILVVIAANSRIMGTLTAPWWMLLLGGVSVAVMTFAGVTRSRNQIPLIWQAEMHRIGRVLRALGAMAPWTSAIASLRLMQWLYSFRLISPTTADGFFRTAKWLERCGDNIVGNRGKTHQSPDDRRHHRDDHRT